MHNLLVQAGFNLLQDTTIVHFSCIIGGASKFSRFPLLFKTSSVPQRILRPYPLGPILVPNAQTRFKFSRNYLIPKESQKILQKHLKRSFSTGPRRRRLLTGSNGRRLLTGSGGGERGGRRRRGARQCTRERIPAHPIPFDAARLAFSQPSPSAQHLANFFPHILLSGMGSADISRWQAAQALHHPAQFTGRKPNPGRRGGAGSHTRFGFR